MTKFKSARSNLDVNSRIPETLTAYLRHAITEFPVGPKEDYLRSECFSKYVSVDTDPPAVRRERAINKWLATERTNEATNVRLQLLHGEYNILPRVTWQRFRETVRRFVCDVIGEVPSWDYHNLESSTFQGGFSGGATTSRQRTSSHPCGKYLGKADVTESAMPFVTELFDDFRVWSDLRGADPLMIVPGNVLFTVPKNAEIDRCACKEPDLNMYVQRGFGATIRRHLRHVGIDLNDQSRNRDLARLGSRDGTLATLDLSSASDSISHELVYQFLPDLWYTALNAVRSHKTEITLGTGELYVHTNEMFSSMGNGFTFELESLLFYCISRAVAFHLNVPGVISVYGDDIIVPTEIADLLSFVLGVLGFEVNTKKSFSTGPFRESCGGHYYNGLDITPFYVKAPLTRITDVIHTCNALRKWSLTSTGLCDEEVYDLWLKLASYVPFRFWGGHDLSDKHRLVSPKRPDKCFTLKAKVITDRQYSDEGKYLLWLDQGRKRTVGLTDDIIRCQIETTVYRARRTRDVRPRELVPHFLQEVTAE